MIQYVVLGCGPAGRAAAAEIRRRDRGGRVTMVSREAVPFYLKPAIADFAAGRAKREEVVIPDARLVADSDVEVRAGARVMNLFPHESRVLLSDGTSLYFDRLLIATGGAPVLEGYAARLRNKVQTLFTFADAVRVARSGLAKGAWVAVSGAGRPGMEAVRTFVLLGCRVVYLTSHPRFWSETVGMARPVAMERLMASKVEVLFDEAVLDVLDLGGEAYRMVTSSRRTIDVSMVCEAGELAPDTDFLEGSGLLLDEGVVVDLELRTNFDNIYAAGDAARVYDVEEGWHRVNFGWKSAHAQGLVAGHNLVEGGGREVTLGEGHFDVFEGAQTADRWKA
jgi:NADPH-dependent 2,4-dienoyl-CoA reductase/sulfur reductase-like enzyme